jgi:CheY-like chemotaxis protein
MAGKILVIDDDIISQTLLRSTLTHAGYSVIVASNGEDGIQMAAAQQPNLIVLDIMMPGKDGGDVANLLKENPKTKNIPIIFLSSLVENEQSKSCGLNKISFLAKPYDKDTLLNEIKKCSSG